MSGRRVGTHEWGVLADGTLDEYNNNSNNKWWPIGIRAVVQQWHLYMYKCTCGSPVECSAAGHIIYTAVPAQDEGC